MADIPRNWTKGYGDASDFKPNPNTPQYQECSPFLTSEQLRNIGITPQTSENTD